MYKTFCGDNREVLKQFPDNHFDSCVTDPPYELNFMSKSWDNKGIAYDHKLWSEVLRVLKPGGHLLSFGGTRTYHRMVCAIEDAGFEIRDTVMWVYGSGWPKSYNISKGIDKKLGKSGKVVGQKKLWGHNAGSGAGSFSKNQFEGQTGLTRFEDIIVPSSPEAKQWEGWGTATKPSYEPIIYTTKPLNVIPSLLMQIQCKINLLVQNVEKNLELSQAGRKEEMSDFVQKNAPKKTNSKEATGIYQLKMGKENGFLNTILLWQDILGEISKKMSKSTILMENETTTELKILNWLLNQVISQNIIRAKESQADGLRLDAILVESILRSEKKNLKDIQNIIVQEIASRHITDASNVESNSIPIINIVNIVLLNVIIKITQELPQKELAIFAQYAEKSFKQFLVGDQNIAGEDACLKHFQPNYNPLCMARSPLSENTITDNILKWGVGGLNIDGCRIKGSYTCSGGPPGFKSSKGWNNNCMVQLPKRETTGRWPANLIHDGSNEVLELFPITKSGAMNSVAKAGTYNTYGSHQERKVHNPASEGSAARFFYCAKVSPTERNLGLGDAKCTHPTLKPVELMRYLIRLVTPPRGIVLDPFMGSGSTGMACVSEGFDFVGIDIMSEYVEIANARIASVKG